MNLMTVLSPALLFPVMIVLLVVSTFAIFVNADEILMTFTQLIFLVLFFSVSPFVPSSVLMHTFYWILFCFLHFFTWESADIYIVGCRGVTQQTYANTS